MKLSIIIVSYNTKELTLQTLQSVVKEVNSSAKLKNQTEILLIDNNSTDGSVAVCKQLLKQLKFPHHQVLANQNNLGFAKANNQAAALASGDFLLLLNSDTIVQKNALSLLVTAMEQNGINEQTASSQFSGAFDKLGILAPTLLNPDGSIQNQGGSLPSLATIASQMLFLDDLPFLGRFFPSTQHTGLSDFAFHSYDENTPQLIAKGWVAGTAMLIRRELIDDIGLLDSNIFMYGEDQEYCLRARHHHYDVAIHPKAKVTHFGSASSSSANAIIGEIKGYLYIWRKHKPAWQLPVLKTILLTGCLLRQIIYALRGQEKASKIYKEARTVIKWGASFKLQLTMPQNLLLIIASFLLAFIPLFPKIPLFDVLPGYIVRVRLEDIFILLAFLYYLSLVWRKKIDWQNQVSPWIFSYLAVASLSIVSAMFLTPTIPLELLHVGKSVLHLFRYTEYFVLFFLMFSAVKKLKDMRVVLFTLIFTVLAIVIYGYGQKFWYWPVFSTMNREFSKGMVLYLTEHARIQSTFGGHYDLAAYLVIVLPILYLLAIRSQVKKMRLILFGTHLLGLWLLVSSASRTSFIAYIGAIIFGLFLFALREQSFWNKALYFTKKSCGYLLLVAIMMYSFGADMRERLEHVLKAYPKVYLAYESTQKFVSKQADFFSNPLAKIKSLREKQKPDNGIAFDNTDLDSVLSRTDQQPTSTRPSDVYVDVPDRVKVATESSEGAIVITYVEQPRTWSDNALKYGLSFAIRLDELWPNAIKGFLHNPLLGSGYATLNKKEFQQFTEAESTDNNFLRTIGETGLLGFITFYGAIFTLLIILNRQQKASSNEQLRTANIAFIAASVGLLLNATYIDVFASSKVAFTYWALAGAILAYNKLELKNNVKKVKKTSPKQ